MNNEIINLVAEQLNISPTQVNTVLSLLQEGNTVPFIARYRKEMTKGLDEEEIFAIYKEYDYGLKLNERKEAVIRLIDEKGLLTESLQKQIEGCSKLVDVEDLYLPFKEKKKTLATIAKKKGLEPLANEILLYKQFDASNYLSDEVIDVEDALEGARHIISEIVSENVETRKYIRKCIFDSGEITSNKKRNANDELEIYKMYYDYKDKISSMKDYRVLAINRGEKEKVLNVKINANKEKLITYISKKYLKDLNEECSNQISIAVSDSFDRLIFPSIERDIRAALTSKAESSAIKLFSKNLEQLLMQPPLKNKRVLGYDPAYRTGCKLAVVNSLGDLEHIDKIFFEKQPEKKLIELITKYNIEIVAIGNGTASRESEELVSKVIRENSLNVDYIIVNESGASVYSASKIAREEFPSLQVEERSAVSIARRLQDPLAELVKIDSKSIGVGQYQHDVNQKLLKEELDFTVEKIVNQVGVDINSATETILNYISGITPRVAKEIVKYRRKNGRFNSRETIKNVSYLGEKSFEQSAGFLRITEGKNLLDQTSIHPESYHLTQNILQDLKLDLKDIKTEKFKNAVELINLDDCSSKFKSDIYTVENIKNALLQPLRDPRDDLNAPLLRKDVLTLNDVEVGMEFEGTVRNIVDFGAFVDIGLKNDGLVHISKLSKGFVKHPSDVLCIGDIVKTTIIEIDVKKGKVALSMI